MAADCLFCSIGQLYSVTPAPAPGREALRIVKRTGALDAAMRSAQSEISRALEAAQNLPAGPYVDCMVQLAQQSLVRSS